MLIENIKNPMLKDLVIQGRHASGTIVNDLLDALQSSTNDEELITNWQSALEGLKNEVEHYWSELESLKSQIYLQRDKHDYLRIWRLINENKVLRREIHQLQQHNS